MFLLGFVLGVPVGAGAAAAVLLWLALRGERIAPVGADVERPLCWVFECPEPGHTHPRAWV